MARSKEGTVKEIKIYLRPEKVEDVVNALCGEPKAEPQAPADAEPAPQATMPEAVSDLATVPLPAEPAAPVAAAPPAAATSGARAPRD